MLLITDLDNTLYDWVTFYARSFEAMLAGLCKQLGCPEAELVEQFKVLHQNYGTSEQPFVALELPAVRQRFPGASRQELLKLLDEPLHAFNRARKENLRLFDGVEATLKELSSNGIAIVALTEAIAVNAYYRLEKLNVLQYFTRLYAPEGNYQGHPDPDRARSHQPRENFIRYVPKNERKPNPAFLRDICQQERFSPEQTWYVGDSLVRDMSMAREAGVKAVWARYGTSYDKRHWDLLVRITHWTAADVTREEGLQTRYRQTRPNFTVDAFR